MLNVSPIGRSCSQEERVEFCELDKVSSNSWKIPNSPGRGSCGVMARLWSFKKLFSFVRSFSF